MKFQGRGYVYLAERLADGTVGPNAIKLCTDSLNLDLSSESFEHINRCGLQDVVDYRGTKRQSGALSMVLSDTEDRIFALGVVATVTPAGTGSITNEQLPSGILAGQVHFLGAGHQNITGLVIDGLVAGTDYTLDAPSGAVTFLDDVGSPAPTADYSYSNASRVKFFSSSRKEYWLTYDYRNKADPNNAPGLYNFYKVSFDPTANLDLQSEELQLMTLNGSVLADVTRPVTDQFGERVGGFTV